MPMLEILHIGADLALVDQALVFGEDELDGVFEREDVLAVMLVDVVQHARDRRALARAGDAGQQHHPLVELAKLLARSGGRFSPAKSGIQLLTLPGHEADVT